MIHGLSLRASSVLVFWSLVGLVGRAHAQYPDPHEGRDLSALPVVGGLFVLGVAAYFLARGKKG